MDSVTASPVRTWTAAKAALPKRDLWGAMARGWRGRCPNCGEGRLFRAFLKTDDSCAQQAVDVAVPPHPLALAIETRFAPPILLQLAIYLPLTLISSLMLLQPVKGAVVGFQWALRMHGFDEGNGIDPDSVMVRATRGADLS